MAIIIIVIIQIFKKQYISHYHPTWMGGTVENDEHDSSFIAAL